MTIRSRSSSDRSRTASSCRRRSRPCCEETIRRTTTARRRQRAPARHLAAPVPRRAPPARPTMLFVLAACSDEEKASTRRVAGRHLRRPRGRRRSTADAALDAARRRRVHLRRADALRELRPRGELAASGRRVFPFAVVCGRRGSRATRRLLHRRRVLPRDVRALGHVDDDPVGVADAVRHSASSSDDMVYAIDVATQNRLRRSRPHARRRVPAPRPDRGRARRA